MCIYMRICVCVCVCACVCAWVCVYTSQQPFGNRFYVSNVFVLTYIHIYRIPCVCVCVCVYDSKLMEEYCVFLCLFQTHGNIYTLTHTHTRDSIYVYICEYEHIRDIKPANSWKHIVYFFVCFLFVCVSCCLVWGRGVGAWVAAQYAQRTP